MVVVKEDGSAPLSSWTAVGSTQDMVRGRCRCRFRHYRCWQVREPQYGEIDAKTLGDESSLVVTDEVRSDLVPGVICDEAWYAAAARDPCSSVRVSTHARGRARMYTCAGISGDMCAGMRVDTCCILHGMAGPECGRARKHM